MPNRDLATVQDIAVAAELIAFFIKDCDREAFDESLLIQSAVIRQIEIIGEATKRLTEPFRLQHCQIPWRQMAGMRDILIHAYDSIDPDEVWNTATRDIPAILERIREIIRLTDAAVADTTP